MNFDLRRAIESKRTFHQELAARPVAEKLRLLDELRERALAIRRASTTARTHDLLMEPPVEYRPDLKSTMASKTTSPN